MSERDTRPGPPMSGDGGERALATESAGAQGRLELLVVGRSLSKAAEGSSVTLVSLAGEQLVVWSDHPSAPGTRLQTRLLDGRELRLKVHRCVRRDDHFELHARMVDASAGVRRTLVAAVGGAPQGPLATGR